jgi:hypothetical protein
MERRGCHPESWLGETADGRRWLTRLVVATLSTFGFKRGVGVERSCTCTLRIHTIGSPVDRHRSTQA